MFLTDKFVDFSYQGFWRLGVAYQMLKYYKESNKSFFDGLRVAPETEESIILVEIFKNRYNGGL